jgi:hypothetical protein
LAHIASQGVGRFFVSGQLFHLRLPKFPRHRFQTPIAYHLYLKGRFYWAKRTEEGLNKSIHYFRQALDLGPTYALAYAGLAEGYVPLAVYCHLGPKDACPKLRERPGALPLVHVLLK